MTGDQLPFAAMLVAGCSSGVALVDAGQDAAQYEAGLSDAQPEASADVRTGDAGQDANEAIRCGFFVNTLPDAFAPVTCSGSNWSAVTACIGDQQPLACSTVVCPADDTRSCVWEGQCGSICCPGRACQGTFP